MLCIGCLKYYYFPTKKNYGRSKYACTFFPVNESVTFVQKRGIRHLPSITVFFTEIQLMLMFLCDPIYYTFFHYNYLRSEMN